MLPGTMYPKKTYGKSLFIGEFKHAVTANAVQPPADHSASPAQKKDETKSVKEHESEELSAENVATSDQINVSRTLTYEIQEEELKQKGDEVKFIWKNSSGQSSATKTSKSPASKAFFTPNKEDQSNDVEQVVDLPIIKEDNVAEADGSNKAAKRKKIVSPSTNLTTASRKHLAQKPPQFPLSKSKIAAKNHRQHKTSTTASDEKNSVNNQQEKGDENEEETSETKELDTEEESTSDKIADEGSQIDHTEFTAANYSSPDPKTIVIKPVDFPGYSENDRDNEGVEPSIVLEPNVVEDIKRDLAVKGIISLPPELQKDVVRQEPEQVEANREEFAQGVLADAHDVDARDENADGSASVDGSYDVDAAAEQSSDFAGEKFDRSREGFKTNKSFEIRRLQAKAEREKEEKKRALFGTRFSKMKARSDHMSRSQPDHQPRSPLKSALKMSSPSGKGASSGGILKEQTPRQNKSRASVRIREPEYDYQEYTDFEMESDSGDSIPSDVSSDSSSLGTRAGDDAYTDLPFSDEEGSSSENSNIHQLYDELDQFSPSRAGFYGGGVRSENVSRDSRRECNTSRATARSSLHLHPSEYTHANYLQPYSEKPMHLFDTLRHERYVQSTESRRPKSNEKIFPSRENTAGKTIQRPGTGETIYAAENERNHSLRSSEHGPRAKRKRFRRGTAKSGHENNASARMARSGSFYANLPVPIGRTTNAENGEPVASYSSKRWKKRVAKFFETSYAKQNSLKSQSNAGDPETLDMGSSKQWKCYTKCKEMMDCSQMSFMRHLLCIAIPTILVTVGLLIVILFTTGVLAK